MKKLNLPNDYLEIMDDFYYVEDVIKRNSKTFYQAFSMLNDHKRYAIYSVYAFCRMADDLIDEKDDVDGLKKFKDHLKLFEENKEVYHPIWNTLRVIFNNFDMDIDPFYDQIEGQKMDINFDQPQSQEDLENYSYYVASSVGLMILPILSKESKKIKDQAIELGIAMQITNILRDLNEDFEEKNRIYIPKEVLDRFNYDMVSDFENKEVSKEFYHVWGYEKNRTLDLYNSSEKMIDYIDDDSKKAVLIALEYYKAILPEVEKNNFDIFGPKTKVSNMDKMKILSKVEKRLKASNS